MCAQNLAVVHKRGFGTYCIAALDQIKDRPPEKRSRKEHFAQDVVQTDQLEVSGKVSVDAVFAEELVVLYVVSLQARALQFPASYPRSPRRIP